MLKFNTSCAVLAYLSSNLLNEVGLSLFRYFEVGLRVCDIVVKTFTFAILSPDEFLFRMSILYFNYLHHLALDAMLLTEMWHDGDSVSMRRLRADGLQVIERAC